MVCHCSEKRRVVLIFWILAVKQTRPLNTVGSFIRSPVFLDHFLVYKIRTIQKIFHAGFWPNSSFKPIAQRNPFFSPSYINIKILLVVILENFMQKFVIATARWAIWSPILRVLGRSGLRVLGKCFGVHFGQFAGFKKLREENNEVQFVFIKPFLILLKKALHS